MTVTVSDRTLPRPAIYSLRKVPKSPQVQQIRLSKSPVGIKNRARQFLCQFDRINCAQSSFGFPNTSKHRQPFTDSNYLPSGSAFRCIGPGAAMLVKVEKDRRNPLHVLPVAR